MKRIPISNNHFLHIYKIEQKNVHDGLDDMRESWSAEEEAEQNNSAYHIDYEQGARDFVELLGDNYCRAFLMTMADELVKTIIKDCKHWCPHVLEGDDYKKFVDYHKAEN